MRFSAEVKAAMNAYRDAAKQKRAADATYLEAHDAFVRAGDATHAASERLKTARAALLEALAGETI